MKLVSIVIPCYRSEDSIRDVMAEIAEAFAEQDKPDYEFEAIFVNDCSPDGVLDVIKELAAQDRRIRVLDLARNFGQHSAIMAGFHYVSGDIVVCMDDDGQTPPNQIFKLINRLGDDCDLVFARYPHKKHSFFRNIGSFLNEIMLRVLLGKPKRLALMSYFACKRYVVEEAKRYRNPYPYIGGLLIRATDKADNVDIDHRYRTHGKSAYTYRKLFSLWMNGFTAFSVLPLRAATFVGLACSLFGFVFGAITVIRKLIDDTIQLGYSSTMAAIMFIGGLILLMLGMLGEYLGRVYISINNSPQFVIRDAINVKDIDTHDQD